MRFQVRPKLHLKQGPAKPFISQKSAIARHWKYSRPDSIWQLLSGEALSKSRRSTTFPHGVIQWFQRRRVVPAPIAHNDPVRLGRAPGIRLILMDRRRIF